MVSSPKILVSLIAALGTVLTGCTPEDDVGPSEPVEEIDSPDFAYQAMVDDGQHIHVATFDDEYMEVTDGEGFGTGDMAPVFSRDGNKIAYSHGNEDVADIFVHDLDDGTQTRLTEFGEEEQRACSPLDFNAANDAIAMVCTTGDDTPSASGIVETDGAVTIFEPDQGLLNLDDDELQVLVGSFSRDDDVVALTWHYDSIADETTQEVRQLDPDEPQDPGEVLVEFDEAGVPLSPVLRYDDDLHILAVSLVTDPEDPDETLMYLADLSTGETEELLGDEPGVKYPLHFDASGERLLYATGTSETEIGRLAIMDLDDGTETVLADEQLQRGTLTGQFFSDGQQVIFADVEADLGNRTWQESSLYTVDADGSNLERIDWVHDAVQVTNPTISPESF